MTGRYRQVAAATAVWLASWGSPLAGQAVGTLGIGASVVEYDGFLPSRAAVLAPALRFDAANVSLGAQAGWTVFESGHHVFQGTAAAAWLSPPRGWWRVELSGSAGASKYAAEPGSGHALGGARVHFFGRQGGGSLGATTGVSSEGAGLGRVPVEISVAGWSVRNRVALVGSVSATWIGPDRYVDVLGAVRWSGARVELEAKAGARPWTASPVRVGDAHVGVFGEVSALVPLARRIALTLSGGSYASDPVRRVLAAKYFTAGLRLDLLGRSGLPIPSIAVALARAERRVSADAGGVQLEIAESGNPRTVRVQVRGAQSVELMGDFTDWAPVALTRSGDGAWEIRLTVPPGVYRLNVRVDGGRWVAPAGTRLERTEFGGPVGVVVVP
ncbi:MAG: glycogen-binding domain-containing protein [Gemmatimonadota bacterium]